MLDTRRLILLRQVGESGSLTDAAHALRLSPSAVSQQIAKLEKEAGVALVDRGPRGVTLTEAGEVLAAHAKGVENLLAAAAVDMAAFRELDRGSLRLATFPTVAAALMPGFVTQFVERYPHIELSITSARIATLTDLLARHEVDLAMLWEYPWMPVSSQDFEVIPLMEDPTVVVLPDTHPLARRRSVSLADLAGEHWVTRAAHPVADVLSRICVREGFIPDVVFASADYTELQAMVAAGIGIAIAPRLAVTQPRRGVRIVALKDNPAPRRILLSWPRGRRPSPAVLGAIKVLRGVGREATVAAR